MNVRRVWTVVSTSRSQPSAPYIHEDFASAEREATRLATACLGETFHVMASVIAVRKQEVTRIEFDADTQQQSEVPF